MAKRFSETKIWEDEWYQSLPTKWKIAWKYLCDKCDEAGIWKPNFSLADFQIKEKIKWLEADQWLNKGKTRVIITDKAWILKDFVPFQYGEAVYTSEHGFHKKIRNMLSKYPIDTLCNRVQEEEGVKEKVEVMVNKGVVRGKFIPPTIEEVQAYCLERKNGVDPQKWHDFYSAKGWMIGKNKMKDWKAAVRTWEDGHMKVLEKKKRIDINTKIAEMKADKTDPVDIKFSLLKEYSELEIDTALGKKY